MTKPALLDFISEAEWDALLQPIPGDLPCGEYLLYDDVYAQVREARREDDPNLSQGDWKIERKRAGWEVAERLCQTALTQRSKDLQLAAWLTEAWTYNYGMAGFYGGLHLLLQLTREYWEHIHPPLDKDDPEQRLSPFIWMNEKFFLPLARTAISAPNVNDAESYTFLDRENAFQMEAGSAAEKEAEAQGRPTRKLVLNSITLTPAAFYQQLSVLLKSAQEVLAELSDQLDELSGKDAPSFGKLSKQLNAFQHLVQRAVGDRPVEEAEYEADETGEEMSAGPGQLIGDEEPMAGHNFRSRKEAYQALAAAADYLLRTEPHSPAPYLIKRAISWGNLSLGELLLEIINDEHDLKSIYTLLGIPNRPDD